MFFCIWRAGIESKCTEKGWVYAKFSAETLSMLILTVEGGGWVSMRLCKTVSDHGVWYLSGAPPLMY